MKSVCEYAAKFGYRCDEAAIGRYRSYRDEVLLRNEFVNLTAIRDPVAFEEKNIVDSLSLLAFEPFRNAKRVLDIGTGAGLPGIPLAIAMPDAHFYLMDSVGKKIRQVGEIASMLGLGNVEVFHARAEEMAREAAYRESFDFVVSRAVANLSTLCEYALPFVQVGGCFVAYKTKAAMEEITDAKRAADILGGASSEIIEPFGPESGHILVCFKKMKHTPEQYPRQAGKPQKQPL
jgi:16S rRNA (guanine527-N7)-methyltransferase